MSLAAREADAPTYVHAAFPYADDEEYLAGTVPFVAQGLAAGEPTLVALPEERLDLLRAALGAAAADPLLRLASMEAIGRNPAWIIPAWSDFLAAHGGAGGPLRGVGEPIWAGRGDDELVECERHEALLNLAFAAVPGFTLLCPYDVARLDERVVARAHENHPYVLAGGALRPSAAYQADVPAVLDAPLPPVPPGARELAFDAASLVAVRRFAAEAAAAYDLPADRRDDLLLAVSEVVSNSVRHGGGAGRLAVWRDGRAVVCEIGDGGLVGDPLAGRVRPRLDEDGGRGLWLVQQLCDLVQHRRTPGGQVVRLHVLR